MFAPQLRAGSSTAVATLNHCVEGRTRCLAVVVDLAARAIVSRFELGDALEARAIALAPDGSLAWDVPAGVALAPAP